MDSCSNWCLPAMPALHQLYSCISVGEIFFPLKAYYLFFIKIFILVRKNDIINTVDNVNKVQMANKKMESGERWDNTWELTRPHLHSQLYM